MRRSRSGGRRRSRRGAPASRPAADDLGALDARRHRARQRRGCARSARRRRAPRCSAHRRIPDRTRKRAAAARALFAQLVSMRGGRGEFRITDSNFEFAVAARAAAGARRASTLMRPAIRPSRRRLARVARLDRATEAIVELLRGRLTITGPTTAVRSPGSLAIEEAEADAALLALEGEGAVLRGSVRERRHLQPQCGPARAAVVRPPPAGAHPSLHAQPAARGDRAGQPGRLHAVPLRLAARRPRRAG